LARSSATGIVQSTSISIRAGFGVISVLAFSGFGIASIIRAKITIVTTSRSSTNTNASGAYIYQSTSIAVVAGKKIIDVNAFAGDSIAMIVGTNIVIITVFCGSTGTDTCITNVASSTGMSIIASIVIVYVDAVSSFFVARIVGTDVIIVAVSVAS